MIEPMISLVAPLLGRSRDEALMQRGVAYSLLGVAAALALFALLGWLVGHAEWAALLPRLPTMKANTALAMLALVVSALCMLEVEGGKGCRLPAAVALLLAGLSLFQSASGIDLGIDQWLATDAHTPSPEAPGRPAAATSIAILLLSLGVLLPQGTRWRPVPVLAAFAVGYTATLGLLLEAPWTGAVGQLFSTVSVPTAACIVLIAAALVGTLPWKGTLLDQLADGDAGAHLLRSVAPLAMLAPAAVIWLQHLASQQGWWGARGGLAVAATVTALLFIVVAVRAAHRIDALQAGLREANEHLEARVVERTQELIEAQAAHARSEATVKARAEFLSKVSHELRTPLGAVVGYAQLLEIDTERRLSATQQTQLGRVRQAGEHLAMLIDDLLAFGSVEAGGVHIERRRERPVALAQQALAMLTPQADAAGIALRLVADEAVSEASMQTDGKRVLQVLANLLSNAIKYNRPQGSVVVEVRVEGGEVKFAVSDTGEGLSPEQIGRLFTPFDRLGRERGSVAGTGIGLALSQRLTAMLGGRIEVRSEPGVGSCFAVWLPLSTVA